MRAVDLVVPSKEISYFWHWLGNSKFASDGGDLTETRAFEIAANVKELYTEFKEQPNG